jgi:predicted lipid carrier protein YhbT
MNTKILGAAIRLVPKKIQSRAIAKALNFIFSEQPLNVNEGTVLHLMVSDIKQQWWFTTQEGEVIPLTKAPVDSSKLVSVSSELSTLLLLRGKSTIESAIDNGDVIFEGDQSQVVISNLKAIKQDTIDELIGRAYHFLKHRKPPRLNIHTVTVTDITSAQDVDFLRDEALRLESSDFELAQHLMSIAHQVRPNGVIIQQKMKEYREKYAN